MDDENKVYFLVRHGMPFKREGKIEDGETGSVFYRPEFHDVVIYDIDSNELQIFNKSGGKKERAMYLSAFGQVFFKCFNFLMNTSLLQRSKSIIYKLLFPDENSASYARTPGKQQQQQAYSPLRVRQCKHHPYPTQN